MLGCDHSSRAHRVALLPVIGAAFAPPPLLGRREDVPAGTGPDVFALYLWRPEAAVRVLCDAADAFHSALALADVVGPVGLLAHVKRRLLESAACA